MDMSDEIIEIIEHFPTDITILNINNKLVYSENLDNFNTVHYYGGINEKSFDIAQKRNIIVKDIIKENMEFIKSFRVTKNNNIYKLQLKVSDEFSAILSLALL